MALPVVPPVSPMLAAPADAVPVGGGGWLYEPKWDGFRSVVFRDGDAVELASRNRRPLTRYFPELVAALRRQVPARCVLDGEIVIAGPHGLDFDALSARIHPAASRIERLAAETPAAFVAFDLLALGDEDLTAHAFATRRARLETALAGAGAPVFVTPATQDPDRARDWFERFEGAGLDGVVAKPLEGRYEFGKRVLVKVKHQRSADCVVGGYRLHRDREGIGSLLLGLHDAADRLQFVGVASGFRAAFRRELLAELGHGTADAEVGAGGEATGGDDAGTDDAGVAGHPWLVGGDRGDVEGLRVPGGESRWTGGKDLSWTALAPTRVVEVRYNQLQGDPLGRWGPPARFRHSTTFLRWRPDRDPDSCRLDQLAVTPPLELGEILGR